MYESLHKLPNDFRPKKLRKFKKISETLGIKGKSYLKDKKTLKKLNGTFFMINFLKAAELLLGDI